MSRKVTAHLFSSVNGVVEDPHLFQFDAFGPEEFQAMGEAIANVTDVIIGRKLWEEWSTYWPDADDPFGAFINPVRKHVVTTTLSGELPWNSVIVDGDPVAYVAKLRQQEGGGISVAGGIETTRVLFGAGAIDTLTLTTHPVVANAGRRLFDESVPLTRLRLVDGRTTPQGNALLTYSLLHADD
jgi:RNA polymerase sigma-70 factor (ECF subfamily)